ncbi:MAG: response regulator [Desulfamplus sp.]|nr:response regulator [Desulfamplus sp.]
MKILIAEDDRTSRTILTAVLTSWEYSPVAVENGTDAWEIMQQPHAPSIAVLDWEMPGMDGISVCRKLRGQDRNQPLYIILLTSRQDSHDKIQGLEAGADDYITKPFDNLELRARLNVGRRMIDLQKQMLEREKLQGVLEMAGAVCHEINQPLQVISGFVEMLVMDVPADDPQYKILKNIDAQTQRIAGLTGKLMRITNYKSKPYLNRQIIDIEQASLTQ